MTPAKKIPDALAYTIHTSTGASNSRSIVRPSGTHLMIDPGAEASVLGEIVIELPLRHLGDVLLPLESLCGKELRRDMLA